MKRTWVVEYTDDPGSGYIAHVSQDGGYFAGELSFGVTPRMTLSYGPSAVIRTAVEALLVAGVAWPERRTRWVVDDRPVDPDWFDWNANVSGRVTCGPASSLETRELY